MDQKMPDIAAKTNRTPEPKEKRRGGFWANLWSKGVKAPSGAPAGSGAGGAGSPASGLGRLALGAGIFATKAGIVTMVLVGSTIAGGLGWVFLGDSAPSREGRFNSLFASRPAASNSQQGTAGSGSQTGKGEGSSLQFLVDANKGETVHGQGDGSEAATSAPASDSAASPTGAAIPGDQTPLNSPGTTKSTGFNPKKIGELSKSMATGSSGAGIRFGSMGASGELSSMPQLGGAKTGRTSGLAADSRALSGRRAVGYNRTGSAGRQLANVRRDHRGATTSQGAGKTYDGGSVSSIGPDAAAPEGAAASGDAGMPDRKVNPNAANRSEVNEPPPTEPGYNVTPWQDALQQGMMLLGAAALLIMAAKKFAELAQKNATAGPTGAVAAAGWFWAAKIAAGLAGLAALGAIYLGSQITFGEYGQPIQGAALMLGGAAALFATYQVVTLPQAIDEKVYGNASSIIEITNYVTLAAFAATMLVPKEEVDSKEFEGGEAPDAKIFGYRSLPPSDKALERFTV